MGTYNGNPLGMAAARANLLEVLTPEAYERLERLGERMAAGCDAVIEAARAPRAHGRARLEGLRGPLHRAVVDYPSNAATTRALELVWTWLMNRGVFATPGREQEWNVTVAHDEAAVDRYVEAFGGLAAELSPRSCGSARA